MAWIGLGGLLLSGCATVRPDFEQSFNAEYQGLEYSNESPSHDRWMRLAATRYGCDTAAISKGVRRWDDIRVGLPPCEIASAIPPREILAFKTATGIREEWRFGSGSRTLLVRLEGPDPRGLQVSFVQWY
jgi:hypothetical protein